MKKKTILVVTGTRAEYGLLRSTMDAIRVRKDLTLSVLVTGMHTLKAFGNTQALIKKDGYPVAATVSIKESDSHTDALAKEIAGIGAYLERKRPDLVLVLGDRDEPLAAALAAAHLQIPIAHVHGGDRSGFVIDEFIRHSLTKFSHLHFAICKSSRNRILQIGEESWRVFNVGAPGFDEILGTKLIARERLARELKLNPDRRWILVMQHPTISDSVDIRSQIRPLLEVLRNDYPQHEKIIVYPNSDNGSNIFIAEIKKFSDLPNFHIFKNLSRDLFLAAQKHSDAIVGNSSSGIIESGALRTPSLTIGGRQRDRDRGANVVEANYDASGIRKGLRYILSPVFKKTVQNSKSPYGAGGAGKKIAKLIALQICNPKLLQKRFVDR